MQSSHTVVLHTILTGWTGRPACAKARTRHTVVLQSRHHGAVLTHHRPCETSLMDRHRNIPMADYEWQTTNSRP